MKQFARSIWDKIFDSVNVWFMLFLMIITIYPLYYVLAASVSDPLELASHTGLLMKPLGFSLRGYSLVLNNPNIAIGYLNTIF